MAFILFQVAMHVDINDSVTYEKTIYFWLNGLAGLYWSVISIKSWHS
jgi:hypothetical protein